MVAAVVAAASVTMAGGRTLLSGSVVVIVSVKAGSAAFSVSVSSPEQSKKSHG